MLLCFLFATFDTYALGQLKQARQEYLVQQIRDQLVETLHYQTPSYTDIVVKSKTKTHLTLGTKFGKKTVQVDLADWVKKDPVLATYANYFTEKRYRTALSKLIDQKSNQIRKDLLPTTEMDEVAVLRYNRLLSVEEKLAAFQQNKGWTLFAPQKLNFKYGKNQFDLLLQFENRW